MIADTFIRRPVTAIVVSIVIVLIGLLALLNLPVSQYPDITPPQVQISGAFTGADAQTVEQTVTTPIESQVNGSPGMTYLQSRVSIATPRLPAEVRQLGITTRKRNPSILMLVAMYSPNGTHNVPFID